MEKTRLFYALMILLFAGTWVFAGENNYESWKTQSDRLLKDPSLIRYYSFNEKQGGFVQDLVAKGALSVYGKNTLTVLSNSPYGEARVKQKKDSFTEYDFPYWSQGRWKGKGALTLGRAKKQLVRTHFYGTESGDFTIVSWVRPHIQGKNRYGGTLFYCGAGGYKNGWEIRWDATSDTSKGRASFIVGYPKGRSVVTADNFTPGIWHCLAVTWQKGKMTIYVDGKMAQSKVAPQKEIIWPKKPEGPILSMPINDVGGMMFGRKSSRIDSNPCDIDELLIYNRSLSEKDIETIYNDGKVMLPRTKQLEEYWLQQQRISQQNNIKLSIPKNTFGYFPNNRAIPVNFSFPANSPIPSGKINIQAEMNGVNGNKVFTKNFEYDFTPEIVNTGSFEIPPQKNGLYWLSLSVRNRAGNIIKKTEYPLAFIPQLPESKDIPQTSPFGTHHAWHKPEHFMMGGNLNRMIRWWRAIERKKGEFDFSWEDKLIELNEKNGVETFFCMQLFPPAWAKSKNGSPNLPQDMEDAKKFVRTLVSRYKGRIKYYEIFNEPNTSHGFKGKNRAKEYVEYLKAIYPVIKEVDPQAKVAAFSGPHWFEWFEQVMAQKPGKNFDICTLHNYGPMPILLSRDRSLVQNVRKLLDDNGRRDAELWNGESGYHQPARENGRPISDSRLKEAFAGRVEYIENVPLARSWMAIVNEQRNAFWQVQHILLDLADGCDKYIMLAGASHYSPLYNNDDGTPSEKGIATAVVSKLLHNSVKVVNIPLTSSNQRAVMIEDKDGTNTLAAFSVTDSALTIEVGRDGKYRGMDYLGNPIKFTATDGLLHLPISEAPVYILDVARTTREVPVIEVVLDKNELSKKENDELYVMHGKLKVHNPWKARKLQLQLKGTTPAPQRLNLKMQSSVSLAPGQIKEVPFVLSGKSIWKGWHQLKFAALEKQKIFARANARFCSNGVVTTVKHVSDRIKLDARNDDLYAGASLQIVESLRNVTRGKPTDGCPLELQWNGPRDLSFYLRTAWRKNEGLYLYIDVTDDKLVVPSAGANQWDYDSLELFVDTRESATRTKKYSKGAHQFIITPNITKQGGEVEAVIYSKKFEPTISAEFYSRKTQNGYVLEGLLKPLPGNEKIFAPGKTIYLDLSINDTGADEPDKLRKATMSLHNTNTGSSSMSYMNTESWGAYILGKDN